MKSLSAAIAQRTRRQLGIITRRQLTELGASRHVRRRMVEDGTLVVLGRQTYRLAGVPPTWAGDVLAATLDTGGLASDLTAAHLRSLDGFTNPPTPIEVLVLHGHQHPRTPLARVHVTRDLPAEDRSLVRPPGGFGNVLIPTTSVERTLLSLSAHVPRLDPDLVIGAAEGALQRGTTTPTKLWSHLERIRRPGRNGVGVLEAILVRRQGGTFTESWLEREFLRLLADAGLPLPECQLRVRQHGVYVARLDFAYASPPITIEVSGHGTHSNRAQRNRDVRRANAITTSTGRRILEFTYDMVVLDPRYVVEVVAAALGLPIAA